MATCSVKEFYSSFLFFFLLLLAQLLLNSLFFLIQAVKDLTNGRSPLLQEPLFGTRPQPYSKLDCDCVLEFLFLNGLWSPNFSCFYMIFCVLFCYNFVRIHLYKIIVLDNNKKQAEKFRNVRPKHLNFTRP